MSENFHKPFDQPDPGAVAHTERFVDAVAKRKPVEFGDVAADTGERALAGLLEDWRDELRFQPAGRVCPEWQAVAAFDRGLAARRRSRRTVALVGTLAASLLSIGGFVAVMGESHPGDTLYSVHTKVFGEPASVHDERIASSAKTDLDLVEQMITRGQWDEAQDKLDAVSGRVQKVKDGDRRQDLVERVNLLTAKVATRDPKATRTPSAAPATLSPSKPVGG